MAGIIELKIKNFRGIKNLDQNFDIKKNMICLVGRGDSCKTTILEAISYALSSSYNIVFYDTDFYNCEISNNIEIEVSLVNIPKELLSESKLGLYKKLYNIKTQTFVKNIEESDDENLHESLTIRLTIDKNLEPSWEVIDFNNEGHYISSSDRAKFNCFFMSDYIDKHFSFNTGTPLYSILKSVQIENEAENTVLDSLRKLRNNIPEITNTKIPPIIEDIKEKSKNFGFDVENPKATIDFKDIAIKDNKVCLHNTNNIPFRLLGKGSKRIVSMAIQLSNNKMQSILLVDEPEQGLEPDKIKHLIRALKDENNGQIFLSTHSRDVITELDSKDIFLVQETQGNITLTNLDIKDLQGTVRACPEAFFAKKIIVCEGSTEIGIYRSLDKWRKNNAKDLMAFKDCYYIDGGGDPSLFDRAKDIKTVGLNNCILMDSDRSSKEKKDELKQQSVQIFDCEENLCIEQQIFKDLSWDKIGELIDYIKLKKYNDPVLLNELKSYKNSLTNITDDTSDLRNAFGLLSNKQKLFKSISLGEMLGDVIFSDWENIKDKHLGKTLEELSNWIDK